MPCARGYDGAEAMTARDPMLDPARFDAVEGSPEYADAMHYEPPARSSLPLMAAGAMLAFAALFVGSTLAVVVGIGAPLAFIVVWALGSHRPAHARGHRRRVRQADDARRVPHLR